MSARSLARAAAGVITATLVPRLLRAGTPTAGFAALYQDQATGVLVLVDDSGARTTVGDNGATLALRGYL